MTKRSGLRLKSSISSPVTRIITPLVAVRRAVPPWTEDVQVRRIDVRLQGIDVEAREEAERGAQYVARPHRTIFSTVRRVAPARPRRTTRARINAHVELKERDALLRNREEFAMTHPLFRIFCFVKRIGEDRDKQVEARNADEEDEREKENERDWLIVRLHDLIHVPITKATL